MPTANEVMAIAKKQIGYKESPANSNRTKYGRKFGMNGEPWCFIFEWWCGMRAAKKHGGTNPFPHNANAAYGQDDIVNKMGGQWVLKKTTSKQARKDALKRYRAGDCVDFDFGAYDAYRRHTGLVEKVVGEYVYCIEGNTTPDEKTGSQSNGGMVCRKRRHYSMICSAARPKYDKETSNAEKLYRVAKMCSWEYGTPYNKREYPSGHKKKAYAKALDKAYPHRDGWGAQTRAGASCDVFVGAVVRASGADKKWPRGLDEVEPYCRSARGRKLWKRIKNPKQKDLLPGDVIYQIFSSGAGHMSIYLGDGKVANAHYYGKSYPVVQKYSNKVRTASECRRFYVYRRRIKK